MATGMADWINEMAWMPRLHSHQEDVKICARLIQTTQVWVLEQDDLVTGFIAVEKGFVNSLYLAPDARGNGHGKALLDAAKRDADRLELWVFQANPRAIRFYQREGFAEVERTDGQGNDEKLPDVRMAWGAP